MNKRTSPLVLTGTVPISLYQGKTKYYGTLTGNTTLVLNGMDEGDVLFLWVTQDATAGRTLTIPAGPGGANQVIGPSTAISAVAAKTSMVTITRIGGIHRIQIIAQA